MLSRLIASTYAGFLELSLWVSLLLSAIGGWIAPVNLFTGERAGLVGVAIGVVVWLFVAVVFFGVFLILEEIRRTVKKIEAAQTRS